MRTVVKRSAAVTASHNESTDTSPMVGGTSGQPEDPNPRATRIHGIDDVAPSGTRDDRPVVEPKRYRVVGGPPSVMYGGGSVRMVLGKIVTDASTDVDLLRRQGVVLEELKEEQAA